MDEFFRLRLKGMGRKREQKLHEIGDQRHIRLVLGCVVQAGDIEHSAGEVVQGMHLWHVGGRNNSDAAVIVTAAACQARGPMS
jgi:hypothetical protein